MKLKSPPSQTARQEGKQTHTEHKEVGWQRGATACFFLTHHQREMGVTQEDRFSCHATSSCTAPTDGLYILPVPYRTAAAAVLVGYVI